MAATTHAPPARPDIPPVRIGREQPHGGPLGLLPDLSRDALGLLSRCARDYGDVVRFRLGPMRVVLISHPQLVEEVLVTRSHDFRKNVGLRRLRSALGNGLLVSEGDAWRRQRRLMQPAFHRQRVAAMAQIMVATADKVLAGWQPGQQRDVYVEMGEITLRIVARTLFGIDVRQDLERIRRSSRIMTEHLRSRLFSLMMLVPDAAPTPGNLRYAAAVRDLDTLAYRLIAERRTAATHADSEDDDDDLLGLLLAARDEHGRGLTDRQVRDEVLTIFSAGHDTTALALTWAWVLLARHPAAEARLRTELDAVLGRRAATAADVAQLPFVQHVGAETLRLYPSAWAIGREATRNTELHGQPIRRGTLVLLSPWVLHRDARFFDDPDAFRPERWADGLAKRLPRLAYLPFGGGQRSCIGSPFAQLELALVLATVAQRFRISLCDPTRPVVPVPVLTLQPRGGVPAIVTPACAAA